MVAEGKSDDDDDDDDDAGFLHEELAMLRI